ncbi:MAG: cobyrinate a,c-diamide synthase [Gemmatimonadota bacterium]|nr:MAG: cobyrinate a,c-diamide synthase [Gemmatimonadota bacterium]
MSIPRILVAGLRGGSGKTLISLGLTAAWRRKGMDVAPFKKGPDYIDAAWLSRAAGRPCRNLDLYLMSPRTVTDSFFLAAGDSDVAVIEGNRGLYDGMDSQGSCSTVELAKLLRASVVLAVDCSKSTRTVAAMVLGCQKLDLQAPLGGVILNQVAGPRHESVIREAVERTTGLPVLGAIGRLERQILPERHLGLVPPQEHDRMDRAIDLAREVAEQGLDLDGISDLAHQVVEQDPQQRSTDVAVTHRLGRVRIGLLRDAAFQFYYPENLEALRRQGADLVEISPVVDSAVPPVDALYIGGGFPETLAPALSRNRQFLASLREAAKAGLPIYAECGGAVFLGERLVYKQKSYDMANVLPVVYGFQQRPKGHGYVELETVSENCFYEVGTRIRGHEFHYTYMQPTSADELNFAFRVHRGFGFDGARDGMSYRNVLACYTHIHALGTPDWAPSLVQAAEAYAAGKNSSGGPAMVVGVSAGT